MSLQQFVILQSNIIDILAMHDQNCVQKQF